MQHIMIDLEMNKIEKQWRGKNKLSSELIEIGAVRMDDHFEVVDTYQSYVKPEFGTMDAVIIDLTGITDDKVKDAPGFAEAMDDFTEWIGPGETQFYSWSMSDIRQFQHEVGHENAILCHVTLIPYLRASQELKTKPTQASVKELQGMGIQPDIIVCRSEQPLDQGLKDKIALFCNVPNTHVLQNLDVEYLYEAPLAMEKENLAKIACECLNLDCPEPDLSDWKSMVNDLRHPDKEVRIALVGKYTALHDAYISVVEALKHGGIPEHATIDIKWVDSEELNVDNVDEVLGDVNGILVPGGFGLRGVEGMILAARYARENKIPYLGLCLGMQVSIIEFARHVCGFNDAHSIELDPNTTHPVIALMPDQDGVEDIGGTLRLGAYPCVLDKDSKAYEVYGTTEISERHRHRYEVNNDYRATLTEHGMKLCGTSPDGRIVEMIELPDHPWFIATQAHPELKSRPNRPHPLFRGFVEAATKCKR